MLIWEHFLFPEVALGNTKLSTSEHTVSRTERGGPFLYSFLFMILDIKARNTLVCVWLRKRFIWQPEQWVSCLWTWRLCSRWQQSPRDRSVEWESLSPPTGSCLLWVSAHFWCICSYIHCVLLLGREHMALRGVVELSGNEKALGLHIEMWVGVPEPRWQLCPRTSSTLRPGQTGPESWACTKPYRTRNAPLSHVHTHTRTLFLCTVALLCSLGCQRLGILSCDRCSRNRWRVSLFSLSVSTQGVKWSPSLPLARSTKLFPPASQEAKDLIGMR